MRIIVTARDGETADALRAATPELRQALAQAGLRVAALEVRLHER
jgi:flagellar hook-length control protein FliK